MQVLIATTNNGKKKEMMSFFQGLKSIEWLSLKDVKTIEDVEETGTTFLENAALKAKYYAEATGLPTLGEDSGLTIAALPNAFGIRTRREIDTSDDIEWLRIFLEMLEGAEDRSATFSSAISFYDPATKATYSVLGETTGEIVEFPMAPLEPGIPVSAVFIPEGFDDVYSAMTTAEKNKCSHRGKSAADMKTWLAAYEKSLESS